MYEKYFLRELFFSTSTVVMMFLVLLLITGSKAGTLFKYMDYDDIISEVFQLPSVYPNCNVRVFDGLDRWPELVCINL